MGTSREYAWLVGVEALLALAPSWPAALVLLLEEGVSPPAADTAPDPEALLLATASASTAADWAIIF